MKPRTIISRYPLLRCSTRRQSIRRARIIDGKPYCAIHASKHFDARESRPALALLETWFSHKNNGHQT